MTIGQFKDRTPSSVRRRLVIFYGVSALTLIVLSAGAVIASRSVARREAFDDASRATSRLGNLVIGPLLTTALTKRDARSVDELNRTVYNRMSDGYLVEITIWDLEGRVVYANDPEVIGQQAELPTEARAAIVAGTSTAGFEDTPEIRGRDFAPTADGYVEVYVPLKRDNQPMLAFEAYYDYTYVNVIATNLLRQIIPLVLVPMFLLQLIQLPIAASLARRVRRHEAERARLLEETLSVSERQRIRIAGDLHDGPIQDLAGIGYALGAVVPAVPPQQQQLMGAVQESVYRAIESLRRLMVDLYPPDLTAAQLPATIASLAVPLQDRGIAVDVSVEPMPELSTDMVTTIYRVARETLANVGQHAQADHVELTLGLTTPGPGVYLRIVDNGIGFDPARLDRRSEGHLGLRLLIDRVRDLNGTMTVTAVATGGTAVEARLPLPPPGEVSFAGARDKSANRPD